MTGRLRQASGSSIGTVAGCSVGAAGASVLRGVTISVDVTRVGFAVAGGGGLAVGILGSTEAAAGRVDIEASAAGAGCAQPARPLTSEISRMMVRDLIDPPIIPRSFHPVGARHFFA
jgi:hypothetical protein